MVTHDDGGYVCAQYNQNTRTTFWLTHCRLYTTPHRYTIIKSDIRVQPRK